MSAEDFEDRQSSAVDAETMGTSIQGTIRKSELLKDDGAVRKFATELYEALSCAVACETEADFDANIMAANTTIPQLVEALKTAKKGAKKEKDTVAVECIDEALSELKELQVEVRDLLPEVES